MGCGVVLQRRTALSARSSGSRGAAGLRVSPPVLALALAGRLLYDYGMYVDMGLLERSGGTGAAGNGTFGSSTPAWRG